MDGLAASLENLKVITGSDTQFSTEKLLSSLNAVISKIKVEVGNSKQVIIEELLANDIIISITILLKKTNSLPVSVTEKLCEIIAELAKDDAARKLCSNSSIISPLVELISHKNEEIVIQSCRALGNICYENDSARGIVKDLRGVEKIVLLLQKLLDLNEMPDNLRTVASGCLFNMTDTYEDTQDQALQAGIVDILLQYLHRFHKNEEVATHCLVVLNCLADLESGQKRLMEKTSLESLIDLFGKEFPDDSLESLLELFGNLAENDNIKLFLAENGFCERNLQLIRNHQQRSRDEESLIMLKTMYDIIILVLTGDESMKYLYDDGKGKVYTEILAWLSHPEESVQVAGALAIGNFARNDAHCIQIVAHQVIKDLLNVLQKHTGVDGDIRLQHAVLSALRNLAIPTQNKAILIDIGVVEKLLPMIAIETFPVVFKLLGTFRMLVDKQEKSAIQLGSNMNLIKRLVTWCETDDHPGVKGEATRLLSWLVKNSRSKSVVESIVKGGAVPHLVGMVSSEHLVMQNEALVALTIMASTDLNTSEEELLKSSLFEFLLKRLSDDNVSEIIQNSLTLVHALSQSTSIRSQMVALDFPKRLKSLSESQNEILGKQAKGVLSVLETAAA